MLPAPSARRPASSAGRSATPASQRRPQHLQHRQRRQPAAAAAAAAGDAAGGGDDPGHLARRKHEPQQPQQPQQQSGENPLWWVEKFEERRRRDAEEQERAEAEGRPPRAAPAAMPFGRLAVQLSGLALACGALVLWPASLCPGGLRSARVWLLFWTYVAFFGGGSVWRLARFGPLAPAARDAQRRPGWGARGALLLFICSMPLLHWVPVVAFCRRRAALPAAGEPLTLFDALGAALLAAALALNWSAARYLGANYDRVVAPRELVQAGPYAHVQHPIYSSYALLFCGFALFLHSAGAAAAALAICAVYFSLRTRLEADVLRGAFGERWEAYAARTKRFVPFLF